LIALSSELLTYPRNEERYQEILRAMKQAMLSRFSPSDFPCHAKQVKQQRRGARWQALPGFLSLFLFLSRH